MFIGLGVYVIISRTREQPTALDQVTGYGIYGDFLAPMVFVISTPSFYLPSPTEERPTSIEVHYVALLPLVRTAVLMPREQ